MPELPEVEVTRRGIEPRIVGRRIDAVVVRQGSLRRPVPVTLGQTLTGMVIETVRRRGKFILIGCVATDAAARSGTLLIHLGMTGTLRVMPADTPVRTHDHVDVVVGDRVLRFNDARRFGLVLWHPDAHGPVLDSGHFSKLGVEPLSDDFDIARGGRLLHRVSRGRSVAIKQFLLAGEAVVGVGNIYASESLFRASIHPATAAGRVSLSRYVVLAEAIRATLTAAIAKGGSTLRDFVGADGASGYFQQDYFAYDRAGLPCRVCGTPIRMIRQGQRSTFYCPHCQH
ncbi:MAG: bifunctional DNA-formamidopyrimidine glycosylase/DNA-(apurinic or apyrimidinic site) lyase [Burkholderiaceae bacterium]